MITDSLDIATETYINEEDFYGKQGKMVSFQIRSIRKYYQHMHVKKYLKLEDVMVLQILCLLNTREKTLHSISQS